MNAPSYSRAYWIALVVGGALMAFGAIGLVSDTGVGSSVQVGGWLVGADIAHDVVVAPLACLIGAGVAYLLPQWCKAPIQAALITTGILLIVVFPALRGYGRDQVPDNSSVQPLDYTSATLTALAVVWAAAAVWLLIRTVRRRGSNASGDRPSPGDAVPGSG